MRGSQGDESTSKAYATNSPIVYGQYDVDGPLGSSGGHSFKGMIELVSLGNWA